MPDPLNENTPENTAPDPAFAPPSGATEGKISQEESVAPTPEVTPPPAQEATPSVTEPMPEPEASAPVSEPINPPNPLYQGSIKNLLQKAKEKIQFRKRAKLEKIMALAQKESKITNDEVQKLLRVSDKTAERYLGQLVKQGRLRRVGPANNAFYQVSS